jgi:MFS family permease
LFLSLAMGGVMTFLPIYGYSRHIESIGLFFTVNAAFLLLARFTTGRLADRIGFNQVLIPSILISTAGFITLAFATSLWQVLIAAACYGLGFGAALPIMSAIMIRLCPPDQRGIANAFYFAAMDIGIGLGAVILGIVSQHYGFTAAYLLTAGFVLTSLLAYMVLFYRKMRRAPAVL